jgi:hypothetical protein
MIYSVFHFSDLHRDLADELDSRVLLESVCRDADRFIDGNPPIPTPSAAIVSGDLVYGVKRDHADPDRELRRQYEQAEEFLVGLAEHFFDGNRQRVVLLPGNHDVSFPHVMSCLTPVAIPPDARARTELISQLWRPNPQLRWAWSDLVLYQIHDPARYEQRLALFAEMYARFYQNVRQFSLTPEEQFDVFDFPDIRFTCLTLNSCYQNDPLRRIGTIHPRCIAAISQQARQPAFAGRLLAAAWHHNLAGGPMQDDYMDAGLVQVLIDAGISFGFHGHQHRSQFVDEKFRLDERRRHMTVLSAGTLCAGPAALPPGEHRSYNVLEVDSDRLVGRLHQRLMSNLDFAQPIWTPGHFAVSQRSFIEFAIAAPLAQRPANLDPSLVLERAEERLRAGALGEAITLLQSLGNEPLARPLLVEALDRLGDDRRTIELLGQPATPAEAVLIGAALNRAGTREQITLFIGCEFVRSTADASVREVVDRLRRKAAQ